MGARRSKVARAPVNDRIAAEAARLYVEQGLPDYRLAKRKAVAQLRLSRDAALPADAEVEQAVAEYLRLFRAESQPELLAGLRTAALRLMKVLKTFSPKLVGPVLSGIADENSVICLHLRADPPEAVQWFLMDRRLRFEIEEVRLLFAGGRSERLPCYRARDGNAEAALIVLNDRQSRWQPLNTADGGPEEQASIAALEALLELQAAVRPGGDGIDAGR